MKVYFTINGFFIHLILFVDLKSLLLAGQIPIIVEMLAYFNNWATYANILCINRYIYLHIWIFMHVKWNNYNDQVYSRPRDWRLSASWGSYSGLPWNQPPKYHSGMVPRNWRETLEWVSSYDDDKRNVVFSQYGCIINWRSSIRNYSF